MIGSTGGKLIYVLMLPLYTRWLSADEYGTTDAITIYADILASLAFLNIADAIFVCPKLSQTEDEKMAYFSSGLFFIGLVSVLAAVLFMSLDYRWIGQLSESVFFKYKWLIWALLVSRYSQTFVQGFTRSLDQLKVYSLAGIVLTGAIALLSFLLIPLWGMYGYVFAIVLAQLVTALYSFCSVRADRYFSLKAIKKQPLKELLAYSTPLVPNSMMWWLINGMNRPLMETRLGLVAIGIYAVANRISGVINSLSSILGLAWGNSVLSEYGKKGFDRFFNNYLRLMSGSFFFACMLLVIFAEDIVRLFTTPAYYDAAKYIPLLALGLCFSCMSSCIGSVFSAVKKSAYFFYASLWGGVVSVGSLLILIPLLGLYGVAASMVLSFLVILVVRWILASRYVHIGYLWLYLFFGVALLLIYLNTFYFDSPIKYAVDVIIIFGVLSTIWGDIKKMVMVVAQK